ncbi:MAG: stage II sporulation protein P [Oscillospiraceae bacterium]|nr:stage II sporulation protein P [Oscillospiraceae bacterium]
MAVHSTPTAKRSPKAKFKSFMVRLAAAVAAVLISPPLASFISHNTDVTGLIVGVWEDEKAAVEQRALSGGSSPLSLEMSNSALLIYRPPPLGGALSDNGEIIPQVLPPLDYGFFEEFPESEFSGYEEVTPIEANPPSFNEPAAQVLSQNIGDTEEESIVFTEIDGRIVKTNFGPGGGSSFVALDLAGQVRNDTDLSNAAVLAESRKLPALFLELNGEPEILIIHTHTTEAFQPSEYDYFDSAYSGRSLDSSRNIVAVGAEIAKSFAAAGITVIHDGTLHDYPAFKDSYKRSAETVRQILAAYPSIKVVLDIHRDAIDGENGSRLAPVTEIDGRNAAQVMILSAADDGTYDMPNYLQNFRLAALFQQHMEHDNPGITRPVWFQYSQYNQHIMPGSLLVEVGTHGNTLEEAKYTGKLIGTSMAEALLQVTRTVDN